MNGFASWKAEMNVPMSFNRRKKVAYRLFVFQYHLEGSEAKGPD
jgi:hypothetical protein